MIDPRSIVRVLARSGKCDTVYLHALALPAPIMACPSTRRERQSGRGRPTLTLHGLGVWLPSL